MQVRDLVAIRNGSVIATVEGDLFKLERWVELMRRNRSYRMDWRCAPEKGYDLLLIGTRWDRDEAVARLLIHASRYEKDMRVELPRRRASGADECNHAAWENLYSNICPGCNRPVF
jgi:hypothetical protein